MAAAINYWMNCWVHERDGKYKFFKLSVTKNSSNEGCLSSLIHTRAFYDWHFFVAKENAEKC